MDALTGAPWLATMRAITGHRERQGAANDPFVLGMATAIASKFPDLAGYCRQYTRDEIPWCGLTIAYCMAINGLRPVYEKGKDLKSFLWADAWRYFGQHCEPRVGAIAIFTRNGGGHVSLIESVGKGTFFIRGGNQSDAINVTVMSKNKLTECRWPSTYPIVDVPGLTTDLVAAGSVA